MNQLGLQRMISQSRIIIQSITTHSIHPCIKMLGSPSHEGPKDKVIRTSVVTHHTFVRHPWVQGRCEAQVGRLHRRHTSPSITLEVSTLLTRPSDSTTILVDTISKTLRATQYALLTWYSSAQWLNQKYHRFRKRLCMSWWTWSMGWLPPQI